MLQLVVSKNNLFFLFLIFGYIFGVIFYEYLGFDYADELMALFLLLFAGIAIWERRKMKELTPLLVLAGVFIFYLVYSLIIHSNTPKAILMDMVIQIKPFLGFYCAYIIAPRLSLEQRSFLAILAVLVGAFILLIGVSGQPYAFFGHPSRLATAATVTAFLYFYCSFYSWSDILVFIIILSNGFFSTRAKFYGFWGVSVFLIIYLKMGYKIKFNFKTIISSIFIIFIAIFLSWRKITIYYIDGLMTTGEMWSRPAMMLTSLFIFVDYFPFGSGFASFGTYPSGLFYSSTYAEYGLNNFFGLTIDNPAFVADAFYPSLAQFGIVGVLLYSLFWIKVLKKSLDFQYTNAQVFLFGIMTFIFFAIEGVADITFTHNRGLYILILLGCILSSKCSPNKLVKHNQAINNV